VTTGAPEDLKLAYCLHGLQQATLRFEDTQWHRNEDAFVAVAECLRRRYLRELRGLT